MFDKLKQLAQLKEMESKMKEERIVVENNGVKIIINGKLEVEEIALNPQLGLEEQQRIIKDCFNEAVRKIQMSMAQKFSGLF
ncbi:MAG: YbaB/EbfC family nucleoid-associated protein [Candidatus Paceibacterota bacterium]|jgi:DNA-binding protein YbaB|nr:YbaB/EbfC family nucleoid-associated protein [Candidatus Paceibacterota bacterium]MDD5621525.1 YbaB/EbfC family nucleoid-associated protein [Candidatus Paceibacterota bacterium]